jgi:hypothetical protein
MMKDLIAGVRYSVTCTVNVVTAVLSTDRKGVFLFIIEQADTFIKGDYVRNASAQISLFTDVTKITS